MYYMRPKKIAFNRFSKNNLSAPFIYSMIFPLVILDVWIEMYHRICFLLYEINYVKRSRYIKSDRHNLKKLSWINKINCMYCGYAIGLLNYASEIGARTETYWCNIKHDENPDFVPPKHHKQFDERQLYQ